MGKVIADNEIGIHLAPVLIGGGTRLFEQLGDRHIQLVPVDVIKSPLAVHLRFRVLR